MSLRCVECRMLWLSACMIHMVRNTLKYVASKDMKSFTSDLKTTIFNAVSEDEGLKARDRIVEKWSAKYPSFMKCWIENWDVVVPIFKFSQDAGKSFTPRMRLKACIPVTENSSASAVCSQATRLCWKLCILQLLKQQKNGLSRFATGLRPTDKCA